MVKKNNQEDPCLVLLNTKNTKYFYFLKPKAAFASWTGIEHVKLTFAEICERVDLKISTMFGISKQSSAIVFSIAWNQLSSNSFCLHTPIHNYICIYKYTYIHIIQGVWSAITIQWKVPIVD